MDNGKLLSRLERYSGQCLAECLDPDFSAAVFEAVEVIKKLQKELMFCRNELCLRCGKYHRSHLGDCDGCRWKEG